MESLVSQKHQFVHKHLLQRMHTEVVDIDIRRLYACSRQRSFATTVVKLHFCLDRIGHFLFHVCCRLDKLIKNSPSGPWIHPLGVKFPGVCIRGPGMSSLEHIQYDGVILVTQFLVGFFLISVK